jgi:predicted O-methyltransferase YrrM
VDTHFPNRHILIEGDSNESVPNFQKENPIVKFDLIFIDGNHRFNQAFNDIINMKELAHENTIVIIDDLQINSVKLAFEKCIEMNIINMGIINRSKHKVWSKCKYIFK